MSDNIDQANKEINEILAKYGLKFHYELDFPIYRQLPAVVRLALEVLEKHEMKISFTIKEK